MPQQQLEANTVRDCLFPEVACLPSIRNNPQVLMAIELLQALEECRKTDYSTSEKSGLVGSAD